MGYKDGDINKLQKGTLWLQIDNWATKKLYRNGSRWSHNQ